MRGAALVILMALLGVHAHLGHDLVPKDELRFSPEVWAQALTATLLISAAPVFILLLIPVHNATQNKRLLNILLAFAMGGLLGDVFLHLLPHSFAPHDHSSGSSCSSVHPHEDSHAHSHHHQQEHSHKHSTGHTHVHGTDQEAHKPHGECKHAHAHQSGHNRDHPVHDHEHDHAAKQHSHDTKGHGHAHSSPEHSHTHAAHAHDHAHEHSHTHDHAHGHAHDDHKGHGHSLEGVMTGMWVIVGIFSFLLVEKVIRGAAGGHGHSHSQPKQHVSPPPSPKRGAKGTGAKKAKKSAKQDHKQAPSSGSKINGLLNLAADFTHNFTDGLAIGATFVAGERMGMITTFAILLHEVPPEIGDFAILVHSGFTKWQAMKLQFLTAIGALLGTAVGLLTGGLAQATSVILPVTAGGFIYISTVSVIPELLSESTSWVQTLLEFVAAFTGVGFMFVIALLE